MPRIRADSIAEHKEQTRVDILRAAAALFRAQGYGETSLSDIASYVGVGRTTLYEYFTDKEDILVSLVDESLPSMMDDMLSGLPDGVSCRNRLSELIGRGLGYVSDEANLGAMLMRELPRLSPMAQRRIGMAHQRLSQAIFACVQTGIERGEFRQMDHRAAGEIVNSLMMSASQTLMRTSQPPDDHQKMTETIIDFVFEGLSKD